MSHRRLIRGDGLNREVAAAQSGDDQAFAEIVEKTSPKVYALCLRLSGNEHDARDIMQDTYLRAYRSIGTFRSDSSFSTWIYRIAANCASTHLQKRQHRNERALEFDVETLGNVVAASPDSDPEIASESTEDRERLIAALARLPFSLRSVVVLGDVYDLSHEEIATELQISRAAVKVRLHRARKKLHEELFATETRVRVSTESATLVALSHPKRRGAAQSKRDKSEEKSA